MSDPGIRWRAPSKLPQCPASMLWSTSPGPGSATNGGATSTSHCCGRAGSTRPGCWRRRLQGPRHHRGFWFLGPRSVFYGERGDEELDEGSPGGDTFLARLANDWEAAAVSAEQVGIRVAHLRTGIVLSTKGGALAKLVTPFKLGVGGRIGDGRSWWSWIAIEDHLAAIEAIIDGDLAGPVNLTAPNSVRSAEFTDALGNALRRPTLIPTPRFALNVLLGSELAAALLFTSSRVMPRALLDSGFSFEHPSVGGALAAALE